MNYKIYVSDRNYSEYVVYDAKTMKKIDASVSPVKYQEEVF